MKGSAFVEEIYNRHISNEELRQLLIAHSESVAEKALRVAAESGIIDEIDPRFVTDAAMLHDIGVVRVNAPSIHCFGDLPYICHGVAGAEILKSEGVGECYGRVCLRHTGSGITPEEIVAQQLPLPAGNYMPVTLEEKLICYADKFFSKSSEPRTEKPLDRVIASMGRHGEGSLARFMELHKLFSKKC